MAKGDRRIVPMLSGAHQYTTYTQFIMAHRYRLESVAIFERWDIAVQKISDAEGKRLGLRSSDSRQWDLFVDNVVTPIRCAFWYGWESVYDLRKLYDQQIELARRAMAPPDILRVYNPPTSPMIPDSPLPDRFDDDREWRGIAEDGMGKDPKRSDISEQDLNDKRLV